MKSRDINRVMNPNNNLMINKKEAKNNQNNSNNKNKVINKRKMIR